MKLRSLPLALVSFSPLAVHADLVGHWTLEEGTGTTTADSSVSGNAGTISAGATWTTVDLPPVPGGTTAALDFDGNDADINIIGYKGVTGTGDRTITAWIKTGINSPAQNKGIVSWGSNISTQKWTFRTQNSNGTPGTIRIEANGGFFVGNTVVTDAEWHHVAVTWANDGTPNIQDAKLYVDGVLDAEFGNIDTPPSASQSIPIATAIGADVQIGDDFQAAHNWDGLIDDVRIYDEALSAVEIAEIALGTQPVTNFQASEEIVASGAPVTLSWESDPTNDSLTIDNGVGDVSGLEMITVNPTADTTYTITGTKGAVTGQEEVTVLVDTAPIVNAFTNVGSELIIVGQSTTLFADVFGEASLDLNGTDVTGQDQIEVSPTETTTYTLSATNPFGTTTAELTVTVLPAGSPDLQWTADGLPDGALAQWTPATNTTGNNGIVFNNTTGGTVQSGVSNFSGVSSWVNSPGYDLFSNPLDSWQDGLGNAATQQDVSWEMVVRPGDFVGTHTLFNTGGNGDGTAIVLTGSVLDFRVQTANTAAERVIVSFDLATIGLATEFYHVVATVDVDPVNPGVVNLYVNGQLVAGPTSSGAALDDWDGGDLAELGKGGNIPGGNPFAFEPFTGDIASFSYFGARILDATQVADKYTALGGSGGELAITNIEYDAVADEIRLTFNSIPGRFYALESTDDLSAEFWLEIDDSISATGTETTYTISGVVLPDPENPRLFYRVLPGLN